MEAILLGQQKRSTRYSVIISNETGDKKYSLMVNNGKLSLLEISSAIPTDDTILIDITTGVSYKLIVENSTLKI